MAQLYLGQGQQAILLCQESLAFSPVFSAMEPFFYLHVGQYAKAEAVFEKYGIPKHLRVLAWAKLAQDHDTEALTVAYAGYDEEPPGNREHRAWAQIPLALALYRLGHSQEAKRELYDCLQTSVQIQGFLPLMQLVPVLALVLADGADDGLKERAVELYTMAESLPFVSNSQLFADLTGKRMTAVAQTLPPTVVAAAQTRGRKLDWWPTAESLLTELQELGWGQPDLH